MKGFKKYLFALLISVSIFLVGVNYVNAEGTAGEILLTKTATKQDKEKGRSADVTLTVNANGFTSVDKTDVVLVLDRSSSMDGKSMENTKAAAKDLIKLLITNKTKSNTRAAIVTYGTDLLTTYTSTELTNDTTTLNNLIESIPNTINTVRGEGTNVHAGLLKADELLKSSSTTTQKIVILLSDGEPTFYVGSDGTRHGMGSSDNYEATYCYITYSGISTSKGKCREYEGSTNIVMTYTKTGYLNPTYNYTTKDAYKPSTNANNQATTMKTNGAKIYTIGFGEGGSTGNAYDFLGKVASEPTEKYRYTASDYTGLKQAFNSIVNDFTTVATKAIVTDTVPADFDVKMDTLPEGVTAKVNPDGTTNIYWEIGDVKSTETDTLTYTVVAKDGHYGCMDTNASATITAISADGNPKYGSSNHISLDFGVPYVPIPGVTVSDEYSNIKQGTTFTTTLTNGILTNDKFSNLHEDEHATVTDEIVLVYDNETNGNAKDITLNQDGTFSYNASKGNIGKITYKYYVKTTVTIDDTTAVVKSNTSTITLNVIQNPTSYVVNYLEKDTKNVISEPLNKTGYVFDEITLAKVKLDITGYEYNSVSVNPLVLQDDTTLNVMNLYYTKRNDLSYTVNYLEKDTNNVLKTANVVNNVEYETVINSKDEVIEIAGYNYVSSDKDSIKIGVEDNVINLYYAKRNDLSYTVNYLEKDTNKVITEAKTVNNVKFGSEVHAGREVIEITGYNYVSSSVELLTIGVENNVMNLYYEKRNDLSYTVNYLEKDTDEVLSEPLMVFDVKFETIINAEDEIIEITGYNYVSSSVESLTIGVEDNVINLYYAKRNDLSYTVNYLEKDTDKVINESKVVNNVEYEAVINAEDEVIEIDGYNYVFSDVELLTIEIEKNIINLYYEKRNDLSYTVNYLEKDTDEVLNDSKVVNNVEFETIINSKDEVIEITGYNYVSSSVESLTIGVEDNVINLYYDAIYGSVKVRYVDKNGNEISESVTTEGKIGTEYKTQSKDIDKYYLVETDGEETGSYSEDEIVVTYVYDLIPKTGIDMNSNSSHMFFITFGLALVVLFIRRKKYN